MHSPSDPLTCPTCGAPVHLGDCGPAAIARGAPPSWHGAPGVAASPPASGPAPCGRPATRIVFRGSRRAFRCDDCASAYVRSGGGGRAAAYVADTVPAERRPAAAYVGPARTCGEEV